MMNSGDFKSSMLKCEWLNFRTIVLGSIDPTHQEFYDYLEEPARYDYTKMYDGCILYVKVIYVAAFFRDIFPQIPCRFILVTGCDDPTVPYDIFPDTQEFTRYIDDDKLIRWYSMNCIVGLSPKLAPIPIGLDYHTGARRTIDWFDDKIVTPEQQEKALNALRSTMLPRCKRKLLCYSNFNMTAGNYHRFGYPRIRALQEIPRDLMYYEMTRPNRITSWENQAKCAFVISPLGNGMDCHRTWEALLLGCIVIVKTSPLDILYRDLPVVIVQEWTEITPAFLEHILLTYETKTFCYDKLTSKYWIDIIRSTPITTTSYKEY